MSEPWDTEKIREAFIYDGGEAAYYDPISGASEQHRIAGGIFDAWLSAYTAEKQAEARRDVILHDVRKAVGMALAFVPWPRVGEEYDATPMVDALTKELFEAQRLREQATNQPDGSQ